MDLDQRIQDLPQELQDMVLSYVIAIESRDVHPMKLEYKVPVGLQLNQKLRAATADVYYGSNHIFHGPKSYDQRNFHAWLSSLTTQHRALIKKVQLFAPYPASDSTSASRANMWFMIYRRQGFSDLINATLRIEWVYYMTTKYFYDIPPGGAEF